MSNRDWVLGAFGLILFGFLAGYYWWNVVRALRTGRIRARFGSWFSKTDQPGFFWFHLWFSLFWAIAMTLIIVLFLAVAVLALLGVE